MKTNEIKENIIGCVAAFNADPYMVETEEQEREIIDQIEEQGIYEIIDAEEFADASARLDGDEKTYQNIYRAGICIFGKLR